MIELSPQQDDAVLEFRAWFNTVASAFSMSDRDKDTPFFLQQGYAGTGKTTVLPFFIESAGLDPMLDVAFMAPTGKAAKVMTDKLRAQGIFAKATTIHKAMYIPKGPKFLAIEAQLWAANEQLKNASGADAHDIKRTISILQKALKRAVRKNEPSFTLNVDSDAMRKPRLIVVDEASMVGSNIANDMLSFGTPILAIGDPGQLQPVGDTPGFFTREPDHILTEIHRQALGNPIIWASLQIREGNKLEYGTHGDALRVVSKACDDVTYDIGRDVQIIVGKNATRHAITRTTRKLCGYDGWNPREGEMMIITRNSQQFPQLVNGTQVMVAKDADPLKNGDVTCSLEVRSESDMPYHLRAVQGVLEENYLGANNYTASERAVISAKGDKNCHEVDWSYAITCHKSQGSQWNEVCVHDESRVFKEHAKAWLYTAVTRAAEKLTVVR